MTNYPIELKVAGGWYKLCWITAPDMPSALRRVFYGVLNGQSRLTVKVTGDNLEIVIKYKEIDDAGE